MFACRTQQVWQAEPLLDCGIRTRAGRLQKRQGASVSRDDATAAADQRQCSFHTMPSDAVLPLPHCWPQILEGGYSAWAKEDRDVEMEE
jgi:hypothetical protein